MPQWNAETYLKFASERTQPSIDLLRRIELTDPRRILDVGCGPGNSTEELRRRWPHSVVVGQFGGDDRAGAAEPSGWHLDRG